MFGDTGVNPRAGHVFPAPNSPTLHRTLSIAPLLRSPFSVEPLIALPIPPESFCDTDRLTLPILESSNTANKFSLIRARVNQAGFKSVFTLLNRGSRQRQDPNTQGKSSANTSKQSLRKKLRSTPTSLRTVREARIRPLCSGSAAILSLCQTL